MLHRIVRMVFQESEVEHFIRIFNKKKAFIEGFEGCVSVMLVEDLRSEHAMATISIWESEENLEAYRNSDLFLETWKEVKPLFAEKAKAWSYTPIS